MDILKSLANFEKNQLENQKEKYSKILKNISDYYK